MSGELDSVIKRREQLEDPQVFDFMRNFYDVYYRLRQPEAVEPMIDSNLLCVGLGGEELFENGEAFMAFTRDVMADIGNPLPYRVTEYLQKPCGTDTWIVFSRVEIRVTTEDWGRVDYNIRLTVTVHGGREGLKITSMHISESADTGESLCYPAVKLLDRERSDPAVQENLEQIMSQLVPGGVVCTYIDREFPLAAANRQVVQMAGFESYRSFYAGFGGNYLNAIHPEDQKRYRYNVQFASSTGKQCECEYRLRRRDGSFLWVHEIGRRTVGKTGLPMMVSALFDISDQMARRERLELETGIDALTGVFNRKGARKRILSQPHGGENWAFFVADLDNFKLVNDFYGHRQGDQILCYTADQLRECFGPEGTVLRLGGDEFALYLNGSFDLQRVLGSLEEITRRYAELLRDVCPMARSTLSVGGVWGRGPGNLDRIYERADANLYRVKHSGKGRVCVTSVEEVRPLP